MKYCIALAWPLLALLLAMPAIAAEGEQPPPPTVEKWIDADGVTHYTDKASVPEGIPSETVVLPELLPSEGEGQSTAERLQKQADRLERERKQRAKEAEAAERAQALEEALQRDELVEVPPKKKKKRRRKTPRPEPAPPPAPPTKPSPGFNQ